jgi:hypothetical protein
VTPTWHQVTLFNTDPAHASTLRIPLSGDTAEGTLGLAAAADYYAYDFWNDRYVGRFRGSDTLHVSLRPGEARVLSVRRVERHPQPLSTNRHISQGAIDLAPAPHWKSGALTGSACVVGGEPYSVVLAGNGFGAAAATSSSGTVSIHPLTGAPGLWTLSLDAPTSRVVQWSVRFVRAPRPAARP